MCPNIPLYCCLCLYHNPFHPSCPFHDCSKKPLVEVIKVAKADQSEPSPTTNNKIIFIVEGRIRFSFRELLAHESVKGQMIFLPADEQYSYEVLADGMIVVLRLHKPITLCRMFPIEKLYRSQATTQEHSQERGKKHRYAGDQPKDLALS